MKRILTMAAMAGALVMAPQSADAQFFKKLGQAIEKADKLLNGSGSSSSSSTAETSQTAQAAAPVTNGKPFKGEWYGDGVYVNIDFYNPSYPNPNAMDNPPCPGGFIVDGTEASIEEVKISGNKATAEMVWPAVDEENVSMTFEYQANGDLVVRSAGLTYRPGYDFDKAKVLPKEITLKKAIPTRRWTMKNSDSGSLMINFYTKSYLGQDADFNDVLCYGLINRMEGQRVEDCSIMKCELLSDTQAAVEYVSSRGGTYSATLVYDPAAKTMTVKDRKVVESSGIDDSYVYDGLVFYGK